jgi:hypothetical protein
MDMACSVGRIAAHRGVLAKLSRITANRAEAVQLDESCDAQVVLTTADSDRFIRTQREIVTAMRGADDMMARARDASSQFTQMVADIKAWCSRRPEVASCILCPRTDDVLAVITVSTEDDDGKVDAAISALDLEMFSRNRFRMTWLMLRASEANGAAAFVDPAEARCIYSAGRGQPPKGF